MNESEDQVIICIPSVYSEAEEWTLNVSKAPKGLMVQKLIISNYLSVCNSFNCKIITERI